MRLKSYFAGSVEAAIELARRELGGEAMLVHSRRTMPENRRLGAYEVVFAVTASHAAGADAPASVVPDTQREAAADEYPRPPAWNRLARDLADVKQQLAKLLETLGRGPVRASGGGLAEALPAEIGAALAAAVFERARGGGSLEDVRAAMASMAATDSSLGATGQPPRIVALIGPPGGGKTTTLIKLAARFGLNARWPAHLISMDGFRIAGAEQLRTYAAILGMSFEQLETTRALEQALEEHRTKELVLIDTPGHAAKDIDCAAELAAFLAARRDIDTHLVLPASMKPADMDRMIERFDVFRPAKLLFTRLDETESFGGVWAAAARSAKPVSFLCDGQQIPEDIAAGSVDAILDRILGRPGERAEFRAREQSAAA